MTISATLHVMNNITLHLTPPCWFDQLEIPSELNVDNWNDNSEAKSEAKSPRPLRGFQVDSSLTRNVPYAVR